MTVVEFPRAPAKPYLVKRSNVVAFPKTPLYLEALASMRRGALEMADSYSADAHPNAALVLLDSARITLHLVSYLPVDEEACSILGDVLNAIGNAYPAMARERRAASLAHCVNFLEHAGMRAPEYVKLIDNPLLARDIIINRAAYRPDNSENTRLVAGAQQWRDIVYRLNEKGSFWLALAVTMPSYASLNVRAGLYRNHPTLLDGVEDAIAGFVAHGEDIYQYDTLFHPAIREKMKRRDWILLDEQS